MKYTIDTNEATIVEFKDITIRARNYSSFEELLDIHTRTFVDYLKQTYPDSLIVKEKILYQCPELDENLDENNDVQ